MEDCRDVSTRRPPGSSGDGQLTGQHPRKSPPAIRPLAPYSAISPWPVLRGVTGPEIATQRPLSPASPHPLVDLDALHGGLGQLLGGICERLAGVEVKTGRGGVALRRSQTFNGAMRKVLILLTILVVGAVVWWTITADERRVTECRDTGIRDLARLARCAKGPEERDEVFSEAREERQAEKRRLFRMRLAEVRSSNRSEVDKRQYKPVSFDDLLDAYGVDYPEHWYERAEIPAQTEERRFSVGGAILSGELPDAGSPEIYLSVSDTLRGAIKADIESLGRGEREFI